MAVRIGTNISSLSAQRSLSNSSDQLSRVSERLSSGQRINRASDDAAGLAVASGLNANRRIFSQAIRNLNDGISALSIADQSLSQLSDIVIRQRELAEQASNGIFSSSQRGALDNEAQELSNEYRRILEITSFNGLNLLDGSNASIQLQAGFGLNSVLAAQFLEQSTTTSSQLLGLGTYNNGDTSYNLTMSGAAPLTDAEMVSGDFNGDGYDDLLVFNDYFDAGWKYTIELYHGGENGLTFEGREEITALGGAMSNLRVEVVGDTATYVADGGTEGLVFGLQGGFFGVFGTFGENPVINDPDNFTFSSGVYDFNGDGFTDRISSDSGGFLMELQDTELEVTSTVNTESLLQAAFSLASESSSRLALDSLQSLLDLLNNKRSTLGAVQSRIGVATDVLRATTENYAAAESRIVDADIAGESAALTRLTILQQIGASVLAQANIQPQLALLLLS